MTASRPLAVSLPPLETRREIVLHVATRAEQLGYEAFFLAEGWGTTPRAARRGRRSDQPDPARHRRPERLGAQRRQPGDARDHPGRAAHPTHRTHDVPPSAQVLHDDLIVWGDAASGRALLERWYAAGAELPVLVLPPNRPVSELNHILESLQPS